MKITLTIIAVIGIALLIFSCTNKTKKQESETITIDPNELIPNELSENDADYILSEFEKQMNK
ncbi:hypothetical protein [Winogradskyella sp. Asnod2-B02-A]|uniref:hypothetical protein n=1 Tax=Winogradskyella sp. Asnod2-B02-A TaxID=3160583 RepID=UPI00386394F7